MLREGSGNAEQYLPGLEEFFKPQKEDLFDKWDAVAKREKRSRTMFAQETIKVDEVAQELRAVQAAIGSRVDVAAFTTEAFRASGAVITGKEALECDLTETPRALREAISNRDRFTARFELPIQEGEVYLSRTHSIVEGLASYVMDTAVDPLGIGIARRCGVMRTNQVERRTTVLLVRLRYHIVTYCGGEAQPLLAEDCQVLAFAGSPQQAQWLDATQAEALLHARPDDNVTPDVAADFLRRILEHFDVIRPHLDQVARQRGEELLDAHHRVRQASRIKNVRYTVEPHLPPDVLGVYVYLPVS